MSNPARALREALDVCRAGAGRRVLAGWRAPDDPTLPDEAVARAARWLRSESAHEALVEARSDGQLDAEAAQRMRNQLAWVVRQEARQAHGRRLAERLAARTLASGEPLRWPDELARLGRADDATARRVLARELEAALAPVAADAAAGQARAEALLLERHRELGGEGDPWALTPPELEALSRMLGDTEDAMEETLTWAMRGLAGGRRSWDAVLRALRAPQLDSETGARTRWRRVAAPFAGADASHALMRRMRAEVRRDAVTPVCGVTCLAVPGDVRVAQADIDQGVASDVMAAEGLGRGLGLALRLRRAPAEERWPIGLCASGALGMLSMQLWGDRLQLTRVQGMPDAQAERVARHGATCALAWLRVWAALAVIDPAAKGGEREAAIESAFSRALCTSVAREVALVAGGDLLGARVRARDALAGLCWHVALRERHDEDWFRNPRAGEAIVGAAVRGNRLGPAALCEELGVELAAASGRILELLA